MKDLTPADCDRIIIVGAGGFGREVLQWARHAWPEHVAKIAGFLSEDPTKLNGHGTNLPILGSPEDFGPRPTDGLLLAIGIPRVRRQVAERLEARGARFLTLIHPTAIVADTAEVGLGTVICPYAIVSDSVRLGRFVLVNYHASLAHDASAGEFSILSPYSGLGGNASIEVDVFLSMHVTVGPRVHVASGAVVSANSCVLQHSPPNSMIYGVPGRVSARLAVGAE
jgi:sugar O-acyltransferase (sialic acid O-acetyltransferase NeuD family)